VIGVAGYLERTGVINGGRDSFMGLTVTIWDSNRRSCLLD
jgi:hypothetical protein